MARPPSADNRRSTEGKRRSWCRVGSCLRAVAVPAASLRQRLRDRLRSSARQGQLPTRHHDRRFPSVERRLSALGGRAIVRHAGHVVPPERASDQLAVDRRLSRARGGALSALSRDRARQRLARLPGRLQTWLCASFRTVIALYNNSVFGLLALGAAVLNLVRPSIVLVSVALAAAGFGWCCIMPGWPGLRPPSSS